MISCTSAARPPGKGRVRVVCGAVYVEEVVIESVRKSSGVVLMAEAGEEEPKMCRCGFFG